MGSFKVHETDSFEIENAVKSIVTSAAVVDDWDESDRCKVNIIVGQAGAAANAGAASANTLRTVSASDSPDVVSLAVIDDWDESDRAKVNPIAGQAGIAANAGAADALTTRVISASDSPDVTSLAIMDDWDESDRAKVNVIVGQAGVDGNAGAASAATIRIIAATDSPDVTALEIIDDAVGTHGAAVGTGGMRSLYEAKDQDGAAFPNTVTEGQDIRGAASLAGVLYVMPASEDGSQTPYDNTNNANRVLEISPITDGYDLTSLVDTTNVSATTHYYPDSDGLSLDGYRDVSFSGKLIDADGTLTLTFEILDDEDTSGGDWIQAYLYDVKNNMTVNSWTVTNGTLTFAIAGNNANWSAIRAVVVASGATNTVIVKSRRKGV